MMTPLILPLFLLSSAGWGLLLVQANKLALKATIAVAVAIALFSQPLVYNGLYHIPGGWRVQQVRPFFFAPKYERIDYFATDVAALSTVLFRPDQSSVLIVPKQVYTESYISLFRFFSPDLDYGIRVYRPNCEDIEAMNGLSVGFCLGYAHPIPSHTKRILSLRRLDSPSTPQSTVMLTTSAYALDKLDN
ncbi:MAG: hypothetical protein HOP34_17060 [Methylococcaceae bacterium]|nr:hypothetical protein [Methylococcaceae bacterium]